MYNVPSYGELIEIINTIMEDRTRYEAIEISSVDGSTEISHVDFEPVSSSESTTVDNLTLDREMEEVINRLIDEGQVTIDRREGEEVVQHEAPAEPERITPRVHRRRLRETDIEIYRHTAKVILEEKRKANQDNLDFKRGIDICLSSVTITPDMLVVDNRGYFYHTTKFKEVKLNTELFESTIYFDKNFNILSPERDTNRRGVSRSFRNVKLNPRFIQSHVDQKSLDYDLTIRKYMIIDKNLFVNSKGNDIKILYRSTMLKITEIFYLKKTLKKEFLKAVNAIEHISKGIESVTPPEDFEIIYQMCGLDKIDIGSYYVRFRDITIQNSTGQSKFLGDFIVKQSIEVYNEIKGRPSITFHKLSGMRLTYNPLDLVRSYQHSHISSGVDGKFRAFCTGSVSYQLINPDIIDIELHIHRLRSFISWESLEGGPYHTIENVDRLGRHYILNTIGRFKKGSLPSPEYVRLFMTHLMSKGGFDNFRDCFKLVKGPAELYFKVNYPKFYQKMIELFSQNINEIFNKRFDQRIYYNPTENLFYQVGNSYSSDNTLMLEAIRIMHRTRNAVYMNGKYVRPVIVSSDNPFKHILFCPSPELMSEIAKVILYHLTEKLKTYGNTRK